MTSTPPPQPPAFTLRARHHTRTHSSSSTARNSSDPSDEDSVSPASNTQTLIASEDKAQISFLDILRVLGGICIILGLFSLFVTGSGGNRGLGESKNGAGSDLTFGLWRRRPWWVKPERLRVWWVRLQHFPYYSPQFHYCSAVAYFCYCSGPAELPSPAPSLNLIPLQRHRSFATNLPCPELHSLRRLRLTASLRSRGRVSFLRRQRRHSGVCHRVFRRQGAAHGRPSRRRGHVPPRRRSRQ